MFGHVHGRYVIDVQSFISKFSAEGVVLRMSSVFYQRRLATGFGDHEIQTLRGYSNSHTALIDALTHARCVNNV